jgi:hypothetical protein
MTRLLSQLHHDEAGFIVSAELVLVSTILVVGLVVGLAEVSNGVNEELEDVGAAFGAVSQSFHFSGWSGHKGCMTGSKFHDSYDFCDGECDISCDTGAKPEGPKKHHW